MIIPCPLEQSIDESTFFKPWKSLPLLFASNSGLVNSRSYNVWKSSTVFHCHLFFTGIQGFKLFVRGDKQNPIGFKGERTLRGKMIQNVGSNCGQPIMTKITWSTAEMGTNSVIFMSCFRCNGSFHISEMESCSTHWLWPDVCYLPCHMETKQVDSPLIKCVLMIFYAFVCFLIIPFSSRNQPTCSVLLLSISVPLLRTSGDEGFLAFLKQHTKLDIQVGMFAPLRTKTWKVIRLPPSVNVFQISRSIVCK